MRALLLGVCLALLASCSQAAPRGWEPGTGPTFELRTTLRPFTWGGAVTWVGDGLVAKPGGAWELEVGGQGQGGGPGGRGRCEIGAAGRASKGAA